MILYDVENSFVLLLNKCLKNTGQALLVVKKSGREYDLYSWQDKTDVEIIVTENLQENYIILCMETNI